MCQGDKIAYLFDKVETGKKHVEGKEMKRKSNYSRNKACGRGAGGKGLVLLFRV